MANFGETFGYALIVTLFGIGIVFLVLVVLQYVLKAMKLINRQKKESPILTAATGEKAVAQPTVPEAIAPESQEEDELIAVITAAVIACLGSNSRIVVRNIRRIEDATPVWGRVSRLDQMAGRF